MYETREYKGYANTVFMHIRNTPHETLNSNQFIHDLVTEIENYKNDEDSDDVYNNNIAIARCYQVHFISDRNKSELNEANVYGFTDFNGIYLLHNFFTSGQCQLLALETLKTYINPPNNNNILCNNPGYSKPLWPSCDFKKFKWATTGNLYDWSTRRYSGYSEFPQLLKDIVDVVNVHLSDFYTPFTADAAIINCYSKGYFLRLHKDDSEETDDPIINISLGVPAIFCVGGVDQSMLPLSCVLDSGSVVIMSKKSRRALHGISKLLNYRKPNCTTNNLVCSDDFDIKNPYASPYLIKSVPQCQDDIFNGVKYKYDEMNMSNVNQFLSESRISISMRKAKL